MRKLTFAINMTADGYCDHTFAAPDEELMAYFTQQMKNAGTLLYGRVTFEMMFPYWADVAKSGSQDKADLDFAQAINAVPDVIVFSTKLDEENAQAVVRPGRVRVIRGNVREEVMKLKMEAGGEISTGGVMLASELLALGLLDEIRLVVHPVFIGKGRKIFESAHLTEQFAMKLEGTRTFKSGVVELRYHFTG